MITYRNTPTKSARVVFWSFQHSIKNDLKKEIMMIYGNTIKDIIKMYPKWLWAGNIFCLALGLWVIFWL